jgi:hypothetical protein
MGKLKLTDILAIVAAVGILIWMITNFYGGMMIWLISYPLIVFPLIVLYIVSIINMLIAFGKNGIKHNKVKSISHGTVILAIIVMCIYNSELFKSKRIITATLYDDLFQYTLILRANGKCENEVYGLGFSEKFSGSYRLKGDTIIFSRVPYDNKGFIPDTILIDKKEGAIFTERDTIGNFRRVKEFMNHFKIIN